MTTFASRRWHVGLVSSALGGLAVLTSCAQSRDVAVVESSALTIACSDDCARATDIPCFEGVCDGTTGKCQIVPSANGASCDDGQFCTVHDACVDGVCKGGASNPCGTTDCLEGICNEATDECVLTARPDGLACAAPDGDLCLLQAQCNAGACVGTEKDCRFAPGVDECHVGKCSPSTGACAVVPGNDGAACHEDGQCTDFQTCLKGACQGGRSRTAWMYSTDASSCHAMVCNKVDGTLAVATIPFGAECPFSPAGSAFECMTGTCKVGGVCAPIVKVGASCPSAADDCSFGTCDADAHCGAAPTNDGAACDDRDACTMAETCQAGTCRGVPRPGVEIYWRDDFSTFGKGWTPTGVNGFSVLTPSALSLEDAQLPPLRDHTATLDGAMLAVLGASPGPTFDSPVIDVSKATGPLVLTAWSALLHDAATAAQIAVYDGTAFVPVWSTPFDDFTEEWAFSPIVVDITRFKNPKLRIRVAITLGDTQYSTAPATWYLDDFTLANRDCATSAPTPTGVGGDGHGH